MRYTVNDLPIGGTGAFTPTLTIPAAASSWGLVERDGAPGTEPQHIVAPTRSWAPPISFDPKTQGSNVSPDVTLRDVYIPYADNMGPASSQGPGIGMTTRRFTPLPVPAIHWTAIPRRAMRPRRSGGRDQVDQPRAFQRFPNWISRPFRSG